MIKGQEQSLIIVAIQNTYKIHDINIKYLIDNTKILDIYIHKSEYVLNIHNIYRCQVNR
jgi:hypothetical protein